MMDLLCGIKQVELGYEMRKGFNIALDTKTLFNVDKAAAIRLKELLNEYKKTTKTYTQTEWMIKTPEGRQFNRDCMMHKYARMEANELRKLAHSLYNETYLDTLSYEHPKPTQSTARSIVINEILDKHFANKVSDITKK